MHWTATIQILVIAIFIIGYMAIIFEKYLHVNKTASALLMSVLTWVVVFSQRSIFPEINIDLISEEVGKASQIIFFLLGAMALVELVDQHKGFQIITDVINTRSKRKMLWMVGLIAFFLSAILDNLTTTIVIVSLLRKLIDNHKDRLFLGAAVVIAANAGGAWTPIGDVTTTMLWIQGYITSAVIMKTLFIPSFFSLIVSLTLLSLQMRGDYPSIFQENRVHTTEPGAKLVFFTGMGILILTPIFKELTGLAPFMSILLGLGILWIMTDIMHHRYENRSYLRMPHVLAEIDISGVLFFLGILLCISSLEVVGILRYMAEWLDMHIGNWAIIATAIGLLSSIVDNVPLVAACMGMYDVSVVPVDSTVWQMIAYAAGTGGSIMIIGSAAGVAFMGLEKVDFIWYVKKISLTALAGFLAGMALYLFMQTI